MSFVELVTFIKDVALALAAAITGIVALKGLGTWQRELTGRANFDAARQLARAMYVLRDQISYCRSPFVAAQEFPEGYRGGDANRANQEEGNAYRHVYRHRWEPVVEAVQDFDAASLEAEALWGSAIRSQCLNFRECVQSLQASIDMFIMDKDQGGHLLEEIALRQEIQAAIWDSKGRDNGFTQRIEQAIEGIEAALRPHLSRG